MTPPSDSSSWRDPTTLTTIACVLVIATAGWFLLGALAPLLRPLCVAVLLAYVLMPFHSRLRKHVGGAASLVLLAGFTASLLVGLALAAYTSVLGLSDELPLLQARALALFQGVEAWVAANAPWLVGDASEERQIEERLADNAAHMATPVLNAIANTLLEGCVVALYLLFLMLEASRFPERVRKAYSPERAEAILNLAGQVNSAIVSYLLAKVKSSLFLAIPVGLVLWVCGVKFALLWAVLTFLCNFIPYLGSVIAYCLPVGFAFLQLELDWRPVTVAVLLLGCQLASASVVEPLLLGRAVGLSPLVILGALAFWGLLWGLPGMFLAVPLTVVAVIVMDHFEFTRPVAKMMSGG